MFNNISGINSQYCLLVRNIISKNHVNTREKSPVFKLELIITISPGSPQIQNKLHTLVWSTNPKDLVMLIGYSNFSLLFNKEHNKLLVFYNNYLLSDIFMFNNNLHGLKKLNAKRRIV